MKNLVNILNVEKIKKESEVNISRGKSLWQFQISFMFVTLWEALYKELEEAMNFDPTSEEGLYCRKKERRSFEGEEYWEYSFYLLEDTWGCEAQVRFYDNGELWFLPVNSAFSYSFRPDEEGHVIMDFEGSRRAFAQQWVCPSTIQDLWGKVSRDWRKADFLQDAEGEVFSQSEFLAFYAKVDAREEC